MVDLKRVEQFFFDAMIHGYAAGIKGTPVPNMPGYKQIVFRDDDFLLVDQWGTTPHSSKSAGTTKIWSQDVPVWFMSYGGEYPDHLIPFLRLAIRSAYESHQFFGGRGPRIFNNGIPFPEKEDSLLYVNQIHVNGFGRFSGYECINSHAKRHIGYHTYWGMSF